MAGFRRLVLVTFLGILLYTLPYIMPPYTILPPPAPVRRAGIPAEFLFWELTFQEVFDMHFVNINIFDQYLCSDFRFERALARRFLPTLPLKGR